MFNSFRQMVNDLREIVNPSQEVVIETPPVIKKVVVGEPETVKAQVHPLIALSSRGGTTINLQNNKYGAAMAFNMTVPINSAVRSRVKTVSRATWTIKDDNDNIIYDSEGAGKGNLLSQAIETFENEFDVNLFGAWELSRCVAGETFIHLVANDYGVVNGIEWLNPLDVQVIAPMGIRQRYDYNPHGENLQIPLERMVFDRELNLLDENAGQSPVEVAIRKAQTIINGDLTMLSHLKNNARAGMTVSPAKATQSDPRQATFTDEDMDKIQDAILKTMLGANRHNSTVVLPFPVDINTYEIANIQPVIDLMDKVDKSIYEVLHVPPAIAGNPDTSRFQRSEQDVIVYDNMIVNELMDIQHYVNRKIMPVFEPNRKLRFEFDLSPFIHVSEEDLRISDTSILHYGQGIIDKRAVIQMNSSLYRITGVDVDRLLQLVEAEEKQPPPEPPTEPTTPDESMQDDMDDEQEIEDETPETNGKSLEAANHASIKHQSEGYYWDALIESFDTWTSDNALSELKAFQKYISNRKSADNFQPHYLAGDIFDAILEAQQPRTEIDRQINLLMESQKSLGGLETEFRRGIEGIFDDPKTRESFITRMDQLVTRLGERAYKQGLEDSGVRGDPNEDDRTRIGKIQNRQRDYIRNLADTLFGDNPPSDAQMARKPDQWVNKTLREFYHEGMLSGRRNPMIEWVYNPEKDHCEDCVRLNGQRHRANDWKRSGWKPQDSKLACNGDLCGCDFIRVVGRSRGNF